MTIEVKQGDDIEWNNIATDASAVPISLDGVFIKSEARPQAPESPTIPLFSVSSGDGITVTDGENGLYLIHIKTDDFKVGKYDIDIMYEKNNKFISTDVFELIIVEDVTNDGN